MRIRRRPAVGGEDSLQRQRIFAQRYQLKQRPSASVGAESGQIAHPYDAELARTVHLRGGSVVEDLCDGNREPDCQCA